MDAPFVYSAIFFPRRPLPIWPRGEWSASGMSRVNRDPLRLLANEESQGAQGKPPPQANVTEPMPIESSDSALGEQSELERAS